jgi:hypothetical protein
MRTIFWLENLNGRHNLEELSVNGNIRMDLRVGRV